MYALRKSQKAKRRKTPLTSFKVVAGALLVASFVLIAGLAVPANPTPDDLREMTAHLIVRAGSKSVCQGSGVFIRGFDGQLYILTAAHIVPDACGASVDVGVHLLNSRVLPPVVKTEPIHLDRSRDVAIFRVLWEPISYKVAKVSRKRAKTGEVVQHVGFYNGHTLAHAYATGYVMKREGMLLGSLSVWLDVVNMEVWKGCSGGGMFNSRGELIGTVSGSDERGIALYVPMYLVDESLRAGKRAALF